MYRKPIVYDEVKYEGNIENRWGQLVRRGNGVSVLERDRRRHLLRPRRNLQERRQVLWWSKGGVLKGQSPARLAFLKKVLDDAPAEGIEPIDKWQHPEYGGQPGEYYLVYLGKQTPTSWEFRNSQAAAGQTAIRPTT